MKFFCCEQPRHSFHLETGAVTLGGAADKIYRLVAARRTAVSSINTIMQLARRTIIIVQVCVRAVKCELAPSALIGGETGEHTLCRLTAIARGVWQCGVASGHVKSCDGSQGQQRSVGGEIAGGGGAPFLRAKESSFWGFDTDAPTSASTEDQPTAADKNHPTGWSTWKE